MSLEFIIIMSFCKQCIERLRFPLNGIYISQIKSILKPLRLKAVFFQLIQKRRVKYQIFDSFKNQSVIHTNLIQLQITLSVYELLLELSSCQCISSMFSHSESSFSSSNSNLQAKFKRSFILSSEKEIGRNIEVNPLPKGSQIELDLSLFKTGELKGEASSMEE
ncbi:hypothetical protein TTHERM_000442739 (macronuclear) [Tetrahymena thermophila SB210]|uniref:Uncharacterized protein n=1 Tax=Tetrahymena thermophila (strain SB210) TaxID=312017 RepID=W7XC18_TETTS|nr:hypothetical protein TTHERM_000442739 [Tetrahymena thermophila SB210]EWS74003.1 hypothetical protein TTHERM_000442739 [Tetrahymena thermophila SB210]|eukprot:XP_012653465.1 hypothetical protein TTHERM_000442739 [Tetrahymena thermophila SB210]